MSTSTEDYYLDRSRKKGEIDPKTSPRVLMDEARIADAPAPPDYDRPASVPVIPPSVVQDNLRRIRDSASNTLIRVLPNGLREYHHDVVVREGDGRISTVRDGGHRTDRGEGTTESLDLLAKEGKVRVDKLLPRQKRDGAGKFSK
jgi:hypothetical protein